MSASAFSIDLAVTVIGILAWPKINQTPIRKLNRFEYYEIGLINRLGLILAYCQTLLTQAYLIQGGRPFDQPQRNQSDEGFITHFDVGIKSLSILMIQAMQQNTVPVNASTHLSQCAPVDTWQFGEQICSCEINESSRTPGTYFE